MSFTVNKLSFIDSFQFLSTSLDSLVKNLSKDDFKYLSLEFDNNVLDLVEQNGFYPVNGIKNPDLHLIMQELGKFNLKINIIPNGFEKYISFSINNK